MEGMYRTVGEAVAGLSGVRAGGGRGRITVAASLQASGEPTAGEDCTETVPLPGELGGRERALHGPGRTADVTDLAGGCAGLACLDEPAVTGRRGVSMAGERGVAVLGLIFTGGVFTSGSSLFHSSPMRASLCSRRAAAVRVRCGEEDGRTVERPSPSGRSTPRFTARPSARGTTSR